MATDRKTLPADWAASGRITASGTNRVVYVGEQDGLVRWWITADDTAPTFNSSVGHSIEQGKSEEITLASGERLWLAGSGVEVRATVTDVMKL